MTTPVGQPTLPDSVRTVTPEDDAYRFLRSTYTTRHSPAQILVPRSVDEVSQAVRYAAATRLPVSIRSGGHGLDGLSSNDGGIVVDLGAMNSVSLLEAPAGAEPPLVRVGAGARWAQVASALAPYELAISSGDHGNVGVGGLATAGGLGWLVRTYGLTVDHVRAATVVLPSGEVLRADDAEPDLLWAVRGAGSFVGVVTDLDIEPMRLPAVQLSQVVIELDDHGVALRRWSGFMHTAPRELTMSGIVAASGHQLVLVLTAVFAGADPRAADAALAPLFARRGVHGGAFEPAHYSDLVPTNHLHANVGQQPATTTNALLRRLDDDSARALIATARHPERPFLQIRAIGGAINDVHRDATAFAHRSAEVLVTATVFPPQDRRGLDSAARSLRRHATGAYRNFESHPSEETFRRAFPGPTGDRVRRLAQRYDPEGVLRRSGATRR
ncbi:FAD-binding oxidoreductase [Nocardioides anomalus]|uniref:FAD-binding oxidoreductase n=1 Tax=Nocardioides anomalus TaxID=2712223 RepID=A0A6G6WFU7_9ACTN|nr:FAD-binding oxidoreductase [Nocardioides anomalus]QIG43920.1 FAD-binding oxidoreductase [Nocardioides anomalus]